MDETLRILIVDDDRMMAKTLSDILQLHGYETHTAHSGREALEKLKAYSFGCVLSDIKMPHTSGVELYRSIRSIQPDLPTVLMTAYSADHLVREGLEEGVLAVLTKPLDIGMLLAFLDMLRQECAVAIIDDDRSFCKTLGDLLCLHGFVVSAICEPDRVMDRLDAGFHVVLLDMRLNGVRGDQVLRWIRDRHPDLPVILITAYRPQMEAAIESAAQIGIYACLDKPLPIERLCRLLSQAHNEQLSRTLRDAARGRGWRHTNAALRT